MADREPIQSAEELLERYARGERDFGGIRLRGADLNAAKLMDANLEGADLSRADLNGANLEGADLSDTDLGDADLSEANLSGADLTSADLSGANLTSTDLTGADLSGVALGWTVLCFLDVTSFLGVQPRFDAPSHVDDRSIIKSIHNPPAALKRFLVACGMNPLYAEYAIDSAKAIVAKGGLMQSTFISYGGPDEAFAKKLNQRLLDHMVATFFFPLDAEPGTKLHRQMRKGIHEHDRVILVCSKDSLDRPGVQNELEQTLSREAREGGTEILIPIRLDDYIFDWKPQREGLRQEVLDRVVADFSEHEDEAKFEEGVSRLLRVLRKKREGAPAP